MSLNLVLPNKKYLKSVYEAVAEYQAAPSRFDISDVRQMIGATKTNFTDYFQTVQNQSLGIGLKEGYVPSTTYWLVENLKYIGTFTLRHRLTPNLEKIGGHIAYAVRPSERRKGYGYQGLKLCLKEAANRGIKQVLITCNAENAASYGLIHKAMLEYGGLELEQIKLDNGFEKRTWVKTKK